MAFHLPRALIGLGALLAVCAASHPAMAQTAAPNAAATRVTPFRVMLDQAKIVKLPDRTATLVVGNPLIADVSVQGGTMLVITGKSYGVTNLVALDRAGAVLLDGTIEVQGPGGNMVVVYRGIERESYSCMPNCERRITLGDTAAYFSAALSQSGTLSTQATAINNK